MSKVIDDKLLEFARWVIAEYQQDFGDLCGSDIEDELLALGILHRVTVEGPCGECCTCAEYYDEFPAQCLRLVEGVKEG